MPIEILMPALSPTMEEGTLATWNVKEGDTVSSGDVIAEIETDKATMEVEAVDEGTVGKILVEAGTEGVAVNSVIALLLEEDEDKSDLENWSPGDDKAEAKSGDSKDDQSQSDDKKSKEDQSSKDKDKQSSKDKEKSGKDDKASSEDKGGDVPPAPDDESGNRIKASPLARRLAADAGLDLASISGSGPNGRIVKKDIEAAKSDDKAKSAQKDAPKSQAPSDAAREIDKDEPLKRFGIMADRYEVEKADNITKVSAKRLSESFRDIPHFPLSVDCELDALLDFRKTLNEKAPDGVKVSVNDILIKASGVALKRVPEANSSWIEDGRIARHKHADVSVAVAIEGGLITPIIFDADQKGLIQISEEMKDLASRARDRKLQPGEYQGGTFSLSNLGMFGVKNFASIVNPPQGMIMSVGAGEQRPVVKDGALAIATVMTVTVTCDHRVVDGATGARWIKAFKGFVEDPMTLLM